jgi:hypothetical protein
LLVFFSLIEVVATIILDNTQKKKRAVRIDRYCRVIFPVIFGIASIATFAQPRGCAKMAIDADPNEAAC